jgi:hypothetical protein
MNAELEKIFDRAYEWFSAQLVREPYWHVEATGKRRPQWRYFRGDVEKQLPEGPGIYIAYGPNSDTPLYAGESAKLRQRVSYHFSESESARKGSTLKRALTTGEVVQVGPTYKAIRIKCVPVPFGRKEIETRFHLEHGINTKADRAYTAKRTRQIQNELGTGELDRSS